MRRSLYLFMLLAVALVPGSPAAPLVAADQIAYTVGGEIRLAAADGSRVRTLARGGAPSWSPDGRAIAFQSARVPGNGLDIYLMNADGSDQRRLVMHPGGGGEIPINTADDFAPAWSPAFWGIAFTTRRDGNEEIYSMDPIGHRVQRLTNSPAADRDPAWSPDAQFIAFVSDRDGNEEIYRLSARRDLLRLTADSRADRAPSWSPDGRQIVFESFRDGNWELYAMAMDGTGVRRLTHDAAADHNPAYSADGRAIVFASDRHGTRGLYVMDATGGAARRVTSPNEAADNATWRPGVDLELLVNRPVALRRGVTTQVPVRIRNRSSAVVFDVRLAARLPNGLRFVSARTRGARCSGSRTISCFRGRLAPGQSAQIRLAVHPSRCGARVLSLTLESLQMDRAPADNRKRVRLRIRC